MQDDGEFEASLRSITKHASNVKESKRLKIQLIVTAHSQQELSPTVFTKKKEFQGTNFTK